MLAQTRGIVLHQIKYSESSIVAKIYTEAFGLQSYLVRGVRKKKSKNSAAYFQHLSLLDMTVYHKERNNLNNIKEIKPAFTFQDIPYNVFKGSIALFINEFLINALKEEEANKELFNFIFDSICFLDLADDDTNNFHLMFCIHLTKYLGFYPQGIYSQDFPYFDLQEGAFCEDKPAHGNYLEKEAAALLSEIKNHSFENLKNLHPKRSTKQAFLNALVDYYRIHLAGMPEIKSLSVLQSLF